MLCRRPLPLLASSSLSCFAPPAHHHHHRPHGLNKGTFDPTFKMDASKTPALTTLADGQTQHVMCGICYCIPTGIKETPLESFAWHVSQSVTGSQDTAIDQLYSNVFGQLPEGGKANYGKAERQQSARYVIRMLTFDAELLYCRLNQNLPQPQTKPVNPTTWLRDITGSARFQLSSTIQARAIKRGRRLLLSIHQYPRRKFSGSLALPARRAG